MPTVGYTATLDHDFAYPPGFGVGTRVTMPENGWITSVTCYTNVFSGTQNYVSAIYQKTSGTTGSRLSGATSTPVNYGTVPTWLTIPLPAPVFVASGTVIFLVVNCDGNFNLNNGLAGSGEEHDFTMTFNTWPATYTTAANDTNATAIYATYYTLSAPISWIIA